MRLAKESGIETLTREQLAKLDWKRPKKGSNDDWNRDLMVAGNLLQHSHRRGSLCQTIGRKHFRVHNQSIAVLGQQVPVITQLGFLAAALAGQQRIGIGGGLVSLIAPVLSVKVYGRVARIVRRLGISVLPLEALQTRPRFDQRAVHSEMLITG